MANAKCTLVVVAALVSWACSSHDKVDLGSDQATPPGVLGSSLADYSGNWDGYVEAFQFTDGSDRLRLTVDDGGTGTLTAGDDATLRALDPNDYPPAWSDPGEGLPRPGPAIMVPGLPYDLPRVAVENNRIQVGTSTLEAFRDWCELQPPILLSSSADGDLYGCVPNGGTKVENGACYVADTEFVETPCGKLACVYVCQCSADGCSVASGANSPWDIQLDAALGVDGDSLVGTMVLPGNPLVRTTARLVRQ